MIKPLSFTKRAPDVATPEILAALEARLNFHFPPAFVEFCSRWNGEFPSKDNEFYPVPQSFREFHEEYKQCEGILVHIMFGVTEKFRRCSLLKECGLLNEYSNLGIIPITADLFGNHVVLRTDSPMGLVFWQDHELWETSKNPDAPGNFAERPRLIPIAQDLESFYNSLTSDPDETSNM